MNTHTTTQTATAKPSTNMNRIYIAGKVTGLPIHEVTIKFGAAQQKLRDRYPQATIINPLQLVGDWRCPWQLAMRTCIAALLTADAIYLLPDWQQSRGATLEHHIALSLHIQPIYQNPDTAPHNPLPQTQN